MTYRITTWVAASPGSIEISEQEYENIASARRLLFEALFLEEKFDLVAENYFEYETELLSSATRFMVFGDQDYSWVQRERNLISRRIINFLSACRLYLDQSTHHLNNIYEHGSPKISEISKEKNTQYDAHLGYRVMEALRNYVQHRDFPIQSITFAARMVDTQLRSNVLYTVTPIIRVSDLEDDPKFKRSVIEELRMVSDQIDIRPLIRQYMSCLGTIHNRVRTVLSNDVSVWEERINNTIEQFKKMYGSQTSLSGLSIIKDMDDSDPQVTYVFDDLIKHRRELERKNRIQASLAARFVTNQVIDTSA